MQVVLVFLWLRIYNTNIDNGNECVLLIFFIISFLHKQTHKKPRQNNITHNNIYSYNMFLLLNIVLPFFQNSNVENLPPHVLRLVYKEVSALAADPPEGIKIYPSEEDITELHTAIEGPGKDCTVVLVDFIFQVCKKVSFLVKCNC